MRAVQTVPRIDCKTFAKCGKKSLAHCRKYRFGDSECENCKLIRRKPKNRKLDSNGQEWKKCTKCEEYYPLHRFYERTVQRGVKTYTCTVSACKMCVSKGNNETNKKRKKQEL